MNDSQLVEELSRENQKLKQRLQEASNLLVFLSSCIQDQREAFHMALKFQTRLDKSLPLIKSFVGDEKEEEK